ncbi:site-2 protease family protein [bacterium]|nr:site-2 protease family protein [bacterium]
MALTKLLFSLSSNIALTAIGILGIGFIIGFHEFGHFIFCKIFKVRTNSFAIGYGPKIWKKKFKQTEFSLSAIPIGGYVEMAAESPKGPKDPALFTSKPLYQKLFVIFGGVAFNLFFAYMVLCLTFFFGLPKTPLLYPINSTATIQNVSKDSAAEQYGLKVGDKILQIDGQNLAGSAQSLFAITKPLAKKEATLLIERDGIKKEITMTLGSRKIFGETYGTLGVIFEMTEKAGLPLISSIKQGIKLANAYLINTAKAYKNIFVKRETKGLGGPIAIISETVKGAAKGAKIFFLFLAIISINLAVLNLIPLPILDGGQALLFTIEAIIRRQLPERAKEMVFIACWIGMLILFVFLSAKDIWRIITPWTETIKNFFNI